MTKSEQLFHGIAKLTPNAAEGKMFGAMSIKAKNGKNAAFFWNETMTFKLDEKTQLVVLELDGARNGSHIYAPEKPMKGWVCVPPEQSKNWAGLTEAAVEYVSKLD